MRRILHEHSFSRFTHITVYVQEIFSEGPVESVCLLLCKQDEFSKQVQERLNDSLASNSLYLDQIIIKLAGFILKNKTVYNFSLQKMEP